ncbi:hypothetical protein [Streptomyces sp. SP17KL33]|uniref:hypothetical protein n=1 Tax=Streptomyces sp. SP17KL33 TaxID=3002534 RepID=UPI002E79B728|nr:hypothetical protein [Streptomyces sp. SP17KL33]MEE1831816.1 hypothetical protein [Streptomyces sp. SP17KL33]
MVHERGRPAGGGRPSPDRTPPASWPTAAIGHDRSFRSVDELATITAPTLIVPGTDPRHPTALAERAAETLSTGQPAMIPIGDDLRTAEGLARATAPASDPFLRQHIEDARQLAGLLRICMAREGAPAGAGAPSGVASGTVSPAGSSADVGLQQFHRQAVAIMIGHVHGGAAVWVCELRIGPHGQQDGRGVNSQRLPALQGPITLDRLMRCCPVVAHHDIQPSPQHTGQRQSTPADTDCDDLLLTNPQRAELSTSRALNESSAPALAQCRGESPWRCGSGSGIIAV